MSVLPVRLVLAAILCLLGATALASPPQVAYEFNLPQQSLADSLRAIGRQTTTNIMFEPQTVENLTAPPVQGRLSAEDAIKRVLTGTRLMAEQTAPNSVVVAEAPATSRTTSPPTSRSEWKTEYTRLAQADTTQAPEGTSGKSEPQSNKTESSGPESTRAPEPQTEVVVTGSRIARPDLDRLQPTTVISSKVFDERGYNDAGQALSELPAFGVQPASAANTQASFGIAQSFVDFYALGSQRTLTLVNGRRFVSANTPSIFGPASPGQQVDLNVIPTKLIERIETISVGGAPIYGSDAIAGTVNIILKHDFEGLNMDVQGGETERGDAESFRYRVLAGHNFLDNRANVTVVGEYSKAHGLTGSDRPAYASDLGFLAPFNPSPFDTILTPDNRVASINFSGIPVLDDIFNPLPGAPDGTFTVTDANGGLLAFASGSNGGLVPFNPGIITGNPVFREGGDGLSLAAVSNLLSPVERKNFDVLGNFNVTDRTRIFAEGWFSETDAKNLIAQPAYNSAFFGAAGDPSGNIRIKLSNPFLAPAARDAIQQALLAYRDAPPFGVLLDPQWSPDQFYLSRANIDLQSGRAAANQQLARGVVGIAGQLDMGGRSYEWEVAANYGRSRNRTRTPSLVIQNFFNAVDAASDPGSGNIVCAGSLAPGGVVSAPISTVSSECAPMNLFGVGSPSQASRDYVTHVALATSKLTQRDVTASLSGALFQLPAGEVKAAIGFENRRETASFDPDDFYEQGLGSGAPITAISGSFHTNEVYGELLVPIIAEEQGIPLVRSFQFEGAMRRVNNSVAGSANTWTAGFRWSPVEDLQFRGNKTRSIRAPAITELFLPTSQFFTFANDPCDQTFIEQGTAPATRAANCAAEGIPGGFTSNIVNASATASQSGNADLASEKANAKTIGVVIRPRWFPRVNLTVDYIDIALDNAIESLSATDIMDACYDATDYPNNESCARITRDAGHQVTFIRTGYVNAGFRKFKGITSAIDWTFDVPSFGRAPGSLGSIELRANHLKTLDLVTKVGTASPNNQVGELTLNSTIGSKGALSLDYRKNAFSWYWQGLYTGSTKFDNNDTETSKDILRVSSYWLVNTTLGYEVSKHFTARLLVNNVFDNGPPFPALAGTGGNFANATSQYFSGILGRSYLLSAEYRF